MNYNWQILIVISLALTTATDALAQVQRDATASNLADARAILRSWANNWNGTVPKGKSRKSPRTLLLTNKTYTGHFDISNMKFPYRVTIRGQGPFRSNGESGTRIRNSVNLSNSKNITLSLMKIEGGSDRIIADNAEMITLSRLWVQGVVVDPFREEPVSLYGTQLRNVRDFKILNSYFSHFQQSAIFFRDSSSVLAEGNVFGYLGHDSFKSQGHSVLRNISIFRNWSCRNLNTATRYRGGVGIGGEHTDFFQAQPDNDLDNAYFWGNVMVKGESYRYNGASWMAIFMSAGVRSTNMKIRNNIVVGQNRGGITNATESEVPGSDVSHNTLLRVEVGEAGSEQSRTSSFPFVYGDYTNKSYNFVTVPAADSKPDYGQGNNGLLLALGALPEVDFDRIKNYFSGYPRERGTSFSVLRPKAGTRVHWDYNGSRKKVGAWKRMKEIFVDGTHPGNVGWPVASPWTSQYNSNRGISSKFSGNYDDSGRNK